MGVWNPISNTECCTVTYNGICTKDSSLCWDQILTPCTLGDSSTKAVASHTLPRNFSAELSSATTAAVEGPYHLAGGDCGRRAVKGASMAHPFPPLTSGKLCSFLKGEKWHWSRTLQGIPKTVPGRGSGTWMKGSIWQWMGVLTYLTKTSETLDKKEIF